MANRYIKKKIDISNSKGNVNQNDNEISPHLSKNRYYQKDQSKKCWQGCGEKETLAYCWWEWKLIKPSWKTVRRVHKKLKIELLHLAIPQLGISPKEIKILKRHLRVHGNNLTVQHLVNG
jgi:hypothetical protein